MASTFLTQSICATMSLALVMVDLQEVLIILISNLRFIESPLPLIYWVPLMGKFRFQHGNMT